MVAEGSRPHGGHASRLEGELGGRGGSEAAGDSFWHEGAGYGPKELGCWWTEKESLLKASTQPDDSEVSALHAGAKLTQAVQRRFSRLGQVQL